MHSRFIIANGINFHLKESGEGDLVLLLHGFPEFWYSWVKVIPLLDKQFKVVAPDLRGYGQSEKPTKIKDYNFRILTKDIAEIIKALGYKKAIIVGHDWGGGVAWEFAKLYPEMTEKLIVLNCPPAIKLQNAILTNWKQFKMSWYIFFFQLPFIPEWFLHKNLKNIFWRMLKGWSINKNAFQKEDIEQYEKAFANKSDFTGPLNYYRAAFRALFDKDFRTIPQFNMNTLIIWGEADKALGKWLIDDLEKYFTQKFEIKYIPNCSHWVQQEQPELVAKYILSFIKN
jgi:pimeloyl-ACP methyl ester carboxylesterase